MFLVNGVSKLGKIKYHGAERYILSLQKLFVAVSQDIRVLIIKLADRLHNMRTLKYVRPEKQHRIALETLDIFAPLAYRLGIRKLSCELEDLSFSYVNPKEAERSRELIKEKSQENIPILEKFIKSLKKSLAKEGVVNITTDYRTKGLLSFYKKYLKKEEDVEKIYDVLAVRVITDTVSDCYKILGIIHGIWRPLPGRIKDFMQYQNPMVIKVFIPLFLLATVVLWRFRFVLKRCTEMLNTVLPLISHTKRMVVSRQTQKIVPLPGSNNFYQNRFPLLEKARSL